LTKDKVQKIEAVNIDKFLPGTVVTKVNTKNLNTKFKVHEHTWLCKLFAVRPFQNKISGNDYDPFNTKSKYCLYDEAHKHYVYTTKWVDLILKVLEKLTMNEIKNHVNNKTVLDIAHYEID
jgi:hypothetical protein